MAIEIIRFKDGLDVITDTFHGTNSIEIKNPMLFQIRNQNLVLQHWLPLSVIKGESTVVEKDNIMCIMEPNDDFKEYYENTVNVLKKELKTMKEEKESGVDVMEAIAELETNKNINIH